MSQAPDVSIVIPVYNEEGILREAVTALRAGAPVPVRRTEAIGCLLPEPAPR